jgi:hypothetical protein
MNWCGGCCIDNIDDVCLVLRRNTRSGHGNQYGIAPHDINTTATGTLNRVRLVSSEDAPVVKLSQVGRCGVVDVEVYYSIVDTEVANVDCRNTTNKVPDAVVRFEVVRPPCVHVGDVEVCRNSDVDLRFR